MPSLDKDIFSSPEGFHSAFMHGLKGVLAQQGLGSFILACANASGQAAIAEQLSGDIQRVYKAFVAADVHSLGGSAEDIQVFQQLQQLGLENLPPTAIRTPEPWLLQFNAMRAFRPMRHAATIPETLRASFNPDGFHFNKPFMLKEQFWQGQAHGHSLSAYYNKFPFADYHLLWLPDRERQHPQYLTRLYHELVWQVCAELNRTLPGFFMAYNALGAYASVNHLHFQSYMGQALPITKAYWCHNGGSVDYPLTVLRFEQMDESWRYIEQLHSMNQPYNLLYSAEVLYVMPRKRQGDYPQPDWSPGFAWREVCGDIVTVAEKDFTTLTAQAITQALGQLAIVV